jgi:histone H3/H4
MSQKQKIKTPKTAKDILDQIGTDETQLSLSQTPDTDIETRTPGTQKKRQRKRITTSHSEEQGVEQGEDLDATPKRSASQVQEDDDEITTKTPHKTPKNKETPKTKDKATPSSSKSSETPKSTKKDTPKSTSKKDETPKVSSSTDQTEEQSKKKGTPKSGTKEVKSKKDKKRKSDSEPARRKTKKYKVSGDEFTKQEIEFFQLIRQEGVIPDAPFMRLVKELVRDIQPEYRISQSGFKTLKAATEHVLTDLFYVANSVALVNHKVTVNDAHLKLAEAITEINGPGTGLSIDSAFKMKDVLKHAGYTDDQVASTTLKNDGILVEAIKKKNDKDKKEAEAAGKSHPKKKIAEDDKDKTYPGHGSVEAAMTRKPSKKEKKNKDVNEDEQTSDTESSSKKKSASKSKKAKKGKDTEDEEHGETEY